MVHLVDACRNREGMAVEMIKYLLENFDAGREREHSRHSANACTLGSPNKRVGWPRLRRLIKMKDGKGETHVTGESFALALSATKQPLVRSSFLYLTPVAGHL
jgi:hypothetical protein